MAAEKAQILIVDDEPTICMVLKRLLERQGYQVTVASNGEEGVSSAGSVQPALIICDWMMPEMDGLQVCRHVKANPNLSTTFFILLTARSEIEDRVAGLDAGADEFLTKPIDPNELQARVRAGLRLHQLSRDLQAQTRILEAELAEAGKYVLSLLPDPWISARDRVKTAWRFIPSQELGGDCFSYYWLDPEHLAIYLLDVSGHGVGAALLSVSVANLLRSRSLPTTDFTQPSEVLKGLNETFPMTTHNEMYFTLWYGVYHPPSRELVYASGGHPPAVLIQPDQLDPVLLRTPNLPIGIMPEATFESQTCHIPVNSRLYVFSDGVYEIANAQDQLWGLTQLTQRIGKLNQDAAAYRDDPAPQPPALDSLVLDRIVQEAQAFGQHPHFEDDFSILAVEF